MKKYFLLILTLFIIVGCATSSESKESSEDMSALELAELILKNLEESDAFTIEYLQFEGFIAENGLSTTGSLVDIDVAWYTHKYEVFSPQNAQYSYIEDYTDTTHTMIQNRCNYDEEEFVFLINDIVQDTGFSKEDCDMYFENGDYEKYHGTDLLSYIVENLENEDTYTVSEEDDYLIVNITDSEGYYLGLKKDGTEAVLTLEGYTATIVQVN